MNIDLHDAALIAPPDDSDNNRDFWGAWNRFWTKVFGRQMPTSGDRAHIGNLLVCYRPGQTADGFVKSGLMSDARHIHVIGDLWIFDYGDTPLETLDQSAFVQPRHLGDHAKLLAENIRDYGRQP